MNLFAFDSVEAEALAAETGTPCFAYRAEVADSRFRSLAAALPARARLAYAVKANPHPALLGLFAGLGSSFDAASGGELAALRAVGVDGSRILFAGPGKSAAELESAVALGARIQVDGIEDLERLERILELRPEGRGHGQALAVNLRVHPLSGVAEGSRIIGGTGPSAFGVDEENIAAFLAEARAFSDIAIRGLQVFAASNELDAERLLANHRAALGIGQRLSERGGLRLDLIDLGGGLGIPYSGGADGLDIDRLGQGLAAMLEEADWFGGDLLLEPGRWLAGPCGVYLSRVIRVKESRGTRFAILEGGINHLLRPLLTGQPFPVTAPGREGESGRQRYTLTGPLCTSLDRLGEAELPQLRPGDLLMFGQTGAYGFTEAMGDFLSHPRPQERFVAQA